MLSTVVSFNIIKLQLLAKQIPCGRLIFKMSQQVNKISYINFALFCLSFRILPWVRQIEILQYFFRMTSGLS